jgi:hypothetical protein
MSQVAKIFYEIQVGDFVHRYSLQGISWSITREMVSLFTEDDPRAFARGKRSIAGSLVANISITLDQPVKGTVVIYFGKETITIRDVEVLNEGSPANCLVADVMMTWVATNIESSFLLNPLKSFDKMTIVGG